MSTHFAFIVALTLGAAHAVYNLNGVCMRLIFINHLGMVNAVVVDGVTIPLAAISGVEERDVSQSGGCASASCWIVGTLLGLAAIVLGGLALSPAPGVAPDPNDGPAAFVCALAAAVAIAAAVTLGRRRAAFALVVSRNDGQAFEIVDPRPAYIAELRRALELALASAGVTRAAAGNEPR